MLRRACSVASIGNIFHFRAGLDRLLAANRDRISFSATAIDLSDSDIVYIAADVPTDDEGESDLAAITALIDRISLHLGDGAVLVVLCQVRQALHTPFQPCQTIV